MEPIKNKFSSIDYAKGNVIEQINKQFKYSDKQIIDEIVDSIESINESMESINQNQDMFLKVNKALSLYVAKCEKERKERNFNEKTNINIKNFEERLKESLTKSSQGSEDKT
ncbi:PREDICTED: uncharacterized protein LOC107071110 [Polistes dominula]|uniref:Uncharacterized protein LOC107071110 n=1 Tax=Polistes dominula TaxID=743375 RepID=A0ABM1IYL7_POLDO|nr:PREDICTED: uncharacterized protein LOC107071110 [Polistes dominula]